MLNSPSPCRTFVQGRDESYGSSDCTPRSTEAAVNGLVKSKTISRPTPLFSSSTAAAARTSWPEPGSPPKQESPLRISTVPGECGTSDDGDDDELFSSPASRLTLDSLRKERARMSLTGDKMTKDLLESSQQRTGAWYMRRNRMATEHHADPPFSSVEDASPTKLRSFAPTPASSTARSKAMSPASASRFSFFNMTTLKGRTTTPVSVPKNDELINLDINAALFPTGAPKDGEPFSPAAFKNLQMNATGLLRKFQSAYQDKAVACQELRAERDAQQDEKTEIETRTAHLKMQLEDMAQKAAESEAIMQALMEELNQEKKLRMEEKTPRETVVISSGMSAISEDLGAEDDQRKKLRRRSVGTTKSDDASLDTDDESVDEVSVFSRSRSPTLAASPMERANNQSISNPPSLPPVIKPVMLEPPRPSRQSQPQISTFQKLIKGISGEAVNKEVMYGCQNCQGQDASVAWDTASLLRDENKGLKQRVGELETAVEEAIDAVMGVNL
ncbi:hypothetical protein QQS21_009784 [Conoideocrella luteorostrata]|uniref:Uncharacterized protein n=1 Tax=Conoideocrella luteorostrata TaxID=1105319 RepID=A0AAJ0CGG2_9HYPO|nr:hypothetical protein QQS21_009784 [Conoideocrella luteorostrata]